LARAARAGYRFSERIKERRTLRATRCVPLVDERPPNASYRAEDGLIATT
jgi:hypothetical protein